MVQNLSSLRFSSALSLPELQPRLLEVGATIEIEARF